MKGVGVVVVGLSVNKLVVISVVDGEVANSVCVDSDVAVVVKIGVVAVIVDDEVVSAIG